MLHLFVFILLIFKSTEVPLNPISPFTLASYYQDNMMLQRGPHSAIIWGYASVESIISTTVLDKLSSTQAKKVSWSSEYIWTLQLRPVYTDQLMNIVLTETYSDTNTTNTLTINNVIFGDIWICSGQSNMQMTLSSTFNGSDEINNGYKYDKIRLLTLERIGSPTPAFDIIKLAQKWSLPSKDSLNGDGWSYFSASCWHFGKRLNEMLNRPIGLISTNYGGTNIEQWSSSEVLKDCNAQNITSNSI